MPHPSNLLTAFVRRDALDKAMFGWVRGITRTLPGVSVRTALGTFAKEFGLKEAQFPIESQLRRYDRMLREFYDDQKTDHATEEQGRA